jgi:hypothetical protein
MKLSKPRMTRQDQQVRYEVDVDSPQGRDTLFFSVEHCHEELLSELSDAALLGLLTPAMAAGDDIVLEGAVSERLYYNLTQSFQALLRVNRPSLKQISIHAADLVSDVPTVARGVATGFSGGIDSFCVLADHYYRDVPQGFRITHLLFNNVGSHGSGGERLFQERYQRLLPAAQKIGLPFLMVNSNLPAFYPKSCSWRQTHTLRNASVALMLQAGIRRYLYASTFPFPAVSVSKTSDSAYRDIMTLPLVSTEAVDIFSVGSAYSRVGKTLRVADVADSRTSLDVCVDAHNDTGYANCSRCWKCLRTMATLDIDGRLEDYSAVFNVAAYRARRDDYLASLHGTRDPLLREVVDFAAERGVPLPAAALLKRYLGVTRIRELSRRVVHGKSGRS